MWCRGPENASVKPPQQLPCEAESTPTQRGLGGREACGSPARTSVLSPFRTWTLLYLSSPFTSDGSYSHLAMAWGSEQGVWQGSIPRVPRHKERWSAFRKKVGAIPKVSSSIHPVPLRAHSL
jgi:hypothetical protein